MEVDVFDQRSNYTGFEDLNEFLLENESITEQFFLEMPIIWDSHP
jgi:hypothetical protein